MKLIPVIDLMRGHVVHARHGLRSRYLPIESKLAKGSRLDVIITALLDLHPFETIYIADLDAIQRTGDHFAGIEALPALFSKIEFWVDSGVSDGGDLKRWRKPGFRPVLASESLLDLSLVSDEVILSLDFEGDKLRGLVDWIDPATWPRDVIVMALTRVGSGLGPGFEQLSRLRELAPQKNYYCAGGVRDLNDLLDLKKMGISGVLLASALHDGRLSVADIQTMVGSL